ncbi:MAG: arginine decarboxylase, partial [Saprospiraceae bacterium]
MSDTYFDLQQENLANSPEVKISKNGELNFHGIDMMALIKQYGAPLKLTYLPKITSQVQLAKAMFKAAFEKVNYQGDYVYCYCTKSSHFSFVLEEVLKNDTHIETSSAFDIPIVNKLHQAGKISKNTYVVCNGYKRPEYTLQISKLINQGFKNVIPILDNEKELDVYLKKTKKPFKVGLRIATEEMPNYSFYTSRLGINPNKILPFYKERIMGLENVELKMLHFFINTGIKDHAYYWNELDKCLQLYVALKLVCPSLDSLNIGGGLPFKTHLGYQYDYQDFIDKIIAKISDTCVKENMTSPNIFTEFGTYTVAESAVNVFEVLDEKQQNDKESWYMVNNSFMNTVPDTWGIDQRFMVLPINKWHAPYKHVYLGGLTCDSMDFYNAEIHNNKLFLPPLDEQEPLYIGLFNTGAYQDALSGFGGLK